MAGDLPDQKQAIPLCGAGNLHIALRRPTSCIAIEKHGLERVILAEIGPSSRLPGCEFDEGERVAASRLQNNGVDMHAAVAGLDEPAEQHAVAAFTLALAAEEYPPPLRDFSRCAPHPICGIAPNMPPMYLR